MKRIIAALALGVFAAAALPAHANNWQWQLDQLKASQARCTCVANAPEPARTGGERVVANDKRAEAPKIMAGAAAPLAK